MNNRHTSSSRSEFARRTASLTAVIMAHGVAAGAAKAGEVATHEGASPANEKPVELPEITVQDEALSLSSPKLPGPLRDLPQSITIIPRRVIEEQGATSLRDVLRNTPGITYRAGEGGNAPGDNLFVRGFEARGDIFLDGVRDAGIYSRDAFNLEQVEVIKGPSSSIAGRGTTGGAINQVSKTPQATPFRSASLAAGTDDHFRATLDVNQPVGADDSATAVRFNAMWTDAGVPGRDEVKRQSWGVAPSVAFGLGKPTQLALRYQHLEQDNLPDYGLPGIAATTPGLDWSNFYGLTRRDYEDVTSDVATAQLDLQPHAGLSLRNLTRYGTNARDSVVTAPRVATAPYATTPPTIMRRNDVKYQDRTDDVIGNFTNLNASIDAGAWHHALATGLEFSRETSTTLGHTRVAASTAQVDVQQPTDMFAPTPDDLPTDSDVLNGSRTHAVGDTVAAYLFDTVDFNARWQASAGLRWDRFTADYDAVSTTGVPTEFSRTDDLLSWRAGLVFRPAPFGSVYFGVGTSFNPSADGAQGLVLSDSVTSINNADLEPEKNRNFELGTKWDLRRGRLAVTAALFRTEKTNARTRGASNEPYVLTGRQSVEGVELGVSGRVTDRWNVFGGYAYMHGEVDASLTVAEDGHELQYTPKHSFNVWSTFDVTPWLSLGAGGQYTGRYYYSNTATVDTIPPQAGYWLLNATAAWRVNDDLTLRLNVNNLADERYIERGYAAHFTPGAARQAILTADYRF